MTVSLNGALVAIAADFVGRYAPWQGIQLRPNPSGGGVFVASTDAGKLAFLGFDPAGKGDEEMVLLPTPDLLKNTRPLKSAERFLELDGQTARCSKVLKTTTQTVEIPITRSAAEAPDLVGAMKKVAEQWGKDVPDCTTAGNFNAGYLARSFKAIEAMGSSITLSHLNGGPLRVEAADHTALVLVMPETARPIPPLPEFLIAFGNS